jgi:hypothetical protein
MTLVFHHGKDTEINEHGEIIGMRLYMIQARHFLRQSMFQTPETQL